MDRRRLYLADRWGRCGLASIVSGDGVDLSRFEQVDRLHSSAPASVDLNTTALERLINAASAFNNLYGEAVYRWAGTGEG